MDFENIIHGFIYSMLMFISVELCDNLLVHCAQKIRTKTVEVNVVTCCFDP